LELVVTHRWLGGNSRAFFASAFRGSQVNPVNAGQFEGLRWWLHRTGLMLLNILLLIRTLRSQNDAFDLQQIESRFFDLLKLQRDNVVEMRVQDTEGRRVFIKILYESAPSRKLLRTRANSVRRA
jgi:hypothetical protein